MLGVSEIRDGSGRVLGAGLAEKIHGRVQMLIVWADDEDDES